MKFDDPTEQKLVLSFLGFVGFIFLVVIVGFISIWFLGNDNLVEQSTEKLLKKKTGLDLDLSP